eukprot:scaffold4346_cov52-Attheya_sp.AAC.3
MPPFDHTNMETWRIIVINHNNVMVHERTNTNAQADGGLRESKRPASNHDQCHKPVDNTEVLGVQASNKITVHYLMS